MSCNLTFHFKRMTCLVKPGPETLPLARKDVRVHEWEDGRVEIHCQGRQPPPHSIFDQNPCVSQGAIVENKRLGEVLSTIQVAQARRDRARLTSKGLTKREKERISAAWAAAGVAPMPPSEPPTEDRLGAVFSFLEGFEVQQKARRKAYNPAGSRVPAASPPTAGHNCHNLATHGRQACKARCSRSSR